MGFNRALCGRMLPSMAHLALLLKVVRFTVDQSGTSLLESLLSQKGLSHTTHMPVSCSWTL